MKILKIVFAVVGISVLFLIGMLSVESNKISDIKSEPTQSSAVEGIQITVPEETDIPSPSPEIVLSPSPTHAPTPASVVTPKPVIKSTSSWSCDCSKTCTQMSSCSEAQYQLNSCGCSQRDADHDGIACDSDCQ